MTDPTPDAPKQRPPFLPAAVLATLVALLLQFSAFSKVATAQKRKFVPFLEDNGFKIVEHWAIGALEMLIVVAVLLGYKWKRTWQVTAVFFGGLAGYAAWALIKDVDCGCFGELVPLPRGFSFVMDVCFLVASLVVAGMLGVTKRGLVATLVAAVIASGLGYGYGVASYKPPDDEPIERIETPVTTNAPWWTPGGHTEDAVPGAVVLVEDLELTQDLRRGDELQTWYVFLHDPGCHVCEEVKPFFDLARSEAEAQEVPAVAFMDFLIPVLEDEHGIEYWRWPSTPTVLLVRGGKILEQHAGEDVLFDVMPSQVIERVMSGDL